MESQWLEWDPPSVFFRVPFINHPITYYAMCFVVGFLVAYFLLVWIFSYYLSENHSIEKEQLRPLSQELVDSFLWFVIVGMIVGARLGHVLLYDWPKFVHNPLMVVKIWEGGLASHTGALGIILGIALYHRWKVPTYPQLTFLRLLDASAIASGFIAACIRIGNFINQEILGTVTTVPWAVIFKHPIDGSAPVPRHPVQLYESATYFALFGLMLFLWRRYRSSWPEGRFVGVFFTLLFTARFFLEFWKEQQSLLLSDQPFLVMGQYLSLPFIAVGLYLIYRK